MADIVTLRAIGLMSGTSFDGIDVALIESNGLQVIKHRHALDIAYVPKERSLLAQAIEVASGCKSVNDTVPAIIEDAAKLITDRHVEAVQQMLDQSKIAATDIDVIGFHGQTILHRPKEGWSWQIGDPQALADTTHIPVVADLRQADVKSGGEGAPFAPIYHAAIASALSAPDFPLMMLNLGGVANLTWLPHNSVIQSPEALLAFDTGPANALIDDWVMAHSEDAYDRDGLVAAAGKTDEIILNMLMDNIYFDRPPPKSLDRNAFSLAPVEQLSFADGAATLTEFSARSIAAAMVHLPAPVKVCLVTGGGRHNPTLMSALKKHLQCRVQSVDEFNIQGDALEAEAFAFLAIRSKLGLPNSFPGTTGVASPCVGGVLYQPQ